KNDQYTQQRDEQAVMKLLRFIFLGFFNYVSINDSYEKKLTEFLTAKGVLITDEEDMRNLKCLLLLLTS
ncbi:7037_t:CDS:1, partial [Funneliformis caledonium]